MKTVFLLLSFGVISALASTPATVQPPTATQAVIEYPDLTGCTLDIRNADTGALVADVDNSLFSGSNLDTRSTSTASSSLRQVVIGKRAAELSSNGRFVSRALQAATHHTYTITCTSSTVYAGDFWTAVPPLGATYPDVAPVDPANPGQYAWPQFDWTVLGPKVIDPFTGVLHALLDNARDNYYFPWGATFSPASVSGTGWTITSGNLPATYAAGLQSGLYGLWGCH